MYPLGTVAALPVNPKPRLVGDINGESVQSNTPNNSALLGVIWKEPWEKVFLDAGLRRRISHAATDRMFTTGLTFRFSLATIHTINWRAPWPFPLMAGQGSMAVSKMNSRQLELIVGREIKFYAESHTR